MNKICRISSYRGTLVKINNTGITKEVDSKVPKKIFLLLEVNIFFSEKGINNRPIKIIRGNLK